MKNNSLALNLKILGLSAGASIRDVKNAYRVLARKWHPDLNSASNAAEKFIAIDTAYKNAIELLKAIEASNIDRDRLRSKVQREPVPSPKQPKASSPLSEDDERVKTQILAYIATLTKRQLYRVAIAEIEILKATISESLEINNVQAEIYKDYGIQLIDCDCLTDAHVYLKKALQVNPCPKLWQEIDLQFDRIQMKMNELS